MLFFARCLPLFSLLAIASACHFAARYATAVVRAVLRCHAYATRSALCTCACYARSSPRNMRAQMRAEIDNLRFAAYAYCHDMRGICRCRARLRLPLTRCLCRCRCCRRADALSPAYAICHRCCYAVLLMRAMMRYVEARAYVNRDAMFFSTQKRSCRYTCRLRRCRRACAMPRCAATAQRCVHALFMLMRRCFSRGHHHVDYYDAAATMLVATAPCRLMPRAFAAASAIRGLMIRYALARRLLRVAYR